MEKHATSNDVARLAGVSQATVSYVLNNKQGQTITLETREKVLKAARLLDYMPSRAARALRSVRTNCVTVSMNKNTMIPRYAQVLEGARGVLEPEGYRLLLCTDALSPNGYPDYLSRQIFHRADGILYIGADGKEPRPSALEYILDHDIPFVAYDSCRDQKQISSVNLDYFTGARQATAYFLSLGGKALAYLRPDIDMEQERQREAGVRAAVRDCPGATLEVFSDFFPANSQLDGGVITERLRALEHPFREFFLRAQTSVPPGTRFISSWGPWAQPMRQFLPPDAEAPAILSLAYSGPVPAGYPDPLLLCCSLPNHMAGQACARLLLERLSGKGEPRQVLLCPAINRPGAPEIY